MSLAGALILAQPIAVAPQSVLDPGGPPAERIVELWNVMLWLGTGIGVLVLAALAYAIFHRRRDAIPEADRAADPRGEQHNDESGGRGHEGEGRPRSEQIGVRVMIGAGFVFPAVVLGALLVYVFRVHHSVALPSHAVSAVDAPPAPGEVTILVTGRQYWWEVTYLDAEPQRRFETANELRIPVGKRVMIRLRTDDVIHSFWVPGLQGKMDLVPGRTNATFIQASKPGVWRGQCAEFCGVQHAKMAFLVVAMMPDEFERWAEGQRQPAPAPRDSAAAADERAYLTSGCVLCHAVRGTNSRGELGPDLTHVGSRLTLAAGTLPNSLGHLHGWVANPQAIKPGSHMPAVPMSTPQFHAIVRYLASLR